MTGGFCSRRYAEQRSTNAERPGSGNKHRDLRSSRAIFWLAAPPQDERRQICRTLIERDLNRSCQPFKSSHHNDALVGTSSLTFSPKRSGTTPRQLRPLAGFTGPTIKGSDLTGSFDDGHFCKADVADLLAKFGIADDFGP